MTDEVVNTETQVDTSAPQPLIDVDPPKPAPAADDQKTEEKPAPPAEEKKEETPEAKLSRRQRAIERATREERDARIVAETELRIAREQLAAKEVAAKPQDAEPQRDDIDPATGAVQDYETYIRRLGRWEGKQGFSEAEKSSREAAKAKADKESGPPLTPHQQAQAKAWQEREAPFIEKTPDYEKAVTPYVQREIGKLSEGARQLIVDSDVGPQLLHQLATDEDLHDRIAELSPHRQVIELGRIEEKIEKPAAEGKKISTAPPPLKPVTGGKSTSQGYRENMSSAEYSEWRKTQTAH